HRRELSAVYNHYVRTTRDPSYHPDTEPLQSVLRPVFGTSFFLADYLREYSFFDAEITLVSSASSKLAWVMAFGLAGSAPARRRVAEARHHRGRSVARLDDDRLGGRGRNGGADLQRRARGAGAPRRGSRALAVQRGVIRGRCGLALAPEHQPQLEAEAHDD